MTLTGRQTVNLVLCLVAVALFGVLNFVSGRIDAVSGLGWDGADYAAMVKDGLDEGTANTQLRPLVVLINRVPFWLTGRMIFTFTAMNFFYVAALCLSLCLLFDVYNGGTVAKAFFVVNVFGCIATAKMFAYYPVLIDLGAYAILCAAIYFIATDRKVPAAIATTLAVTAREFGAAAVMFGVVRGLRRRVQFRELLLTYAPAAAAFVALRLWVAETWAGNTGSEMVSLERLLENRGFWVDPLFVAFFVYFLVTVFGGITMILFARAGACLRYFLDEPEWLSVTALLLASAALGSADIWRYLAYLLPVAAMLFARCSREGELRPAPWVFGVAACATVMTQRPLQRMDLSTYFRDWFPYYLQTGSAPIERGSVSLWPPWGWRFLIAAGLLWLLAGFRAGAKRELPG